MKHASQKKKQGEERKFRKKPEKLMK